MKTEALLRELEETLEVVLDEALEAAHDFEIKAKRLRDPKPTKPSHEGRYGELAAAAFLLKLKAEAAHEILEQFIEAQPEE